jgi:stage III sporulation protein AH
MSNNNAKWPVILFIGRKAKIWLGGLVSLAIVIALLGVLTMQNESPAYFSAQTGLPVNTAVEDASIQFEVEMVEQKISGQDYFVNYRLKRDQFRQETKAMLLELLNSTHEKSKEQAQEKWLELSAKILQEEEIENLLKIKGFQDAVANVLAQNVTVIVYASDLTPKEASTIQDIASRVTKVRSDRIVVSVRN